MVAIGHSPQTVDPAAPIGVQPALMVGLIWRQPVRPVLVSICALVLASPAGATLISLDLYEPGDGLAVHDDATGLTWLRPALTAGLTATELVYGGAGGWYAEGWRHATDEEWCGMTVSFLGAGSGCGDIPLYHAALDPIYLLRVEGDDILDLIDLFGGSSADGIHVIAAGRIGFDDEDSQSARLSRIAYQVADGESELALFTYEIWGALPHGHWLVNDGIAAPVPEPSTLALLALGLAGIAAQSGRHPSSRLRQYVGRAACRTASTPHLTTTGRS